MRELLKLARLLYNSSSKVYRDPDVFNESLPLQNETAYYEIAVRPLGKQGEHAKTARLFDRSAFVAMATIRSSRLNLIGEVICVLVIAFVDGILEVKLVYSAIYIDAISLSFNPTPNNMVTKLDSIETDIEENALQF